MSRTKTGSLLLLSGLAFLAACGTSTPGAATTSVTAKPTASAVPASLASPLPCRARAVIRRPRDHAMVGIRIRTVADAAVAAVVSLPAGHGERLAGRAGARGGESLRFRVGGATPGVRVVIDVRVSRNGRAGACRAAFRPRAALAAVRPSPPAPVPTPAPAPTVHAPAPTPTPTTVSCYPLSDEGTCYEPGEYCRDSDHGASGIAGDGERIVCEDNDGWRWEPA
jgi:hypothetical protein